MLLITIWYSFLGHTHKIDLEPSAFLGHTEPAALFFIIYKQ